MPTAKLQLEIGGMACSFCTETIKKGLGRMQGVAEVYESLAHEEALVAYDPERVSVPILEDTLRSLGYTVGDSRKVRSFYSTVAHADDEPSEPAPLQPGEGGHQERGLRRTDILGKKNLLARSAAGRKKWTQSGLTSGLIAGQ